MTIELRWVVSSTDGTTVADVLRAANVTDKVAISEGRVFVGRTRVENSGHAVVAGDHVIVMTPRESPGEWQWLYRDDHLAVVNKPAGMPTIADQTGKAHALSRKVASALQLDLARLHPTSRLDLDVSGVVAFALSPRARERLAELREEDQYVRRYVAIGFANEAPSELSGVWSLPIGRASDPKLRAVNGRDATPAESRFRVVATAGPLVMLSLEPRTGRTHQLRVHAAHAKMPLLGDRAYGGPKRLTMPNGRVLSLDRIYLHAARVSLLVSEPLIVEAPVPDILRTTWNALGGTEEAWDLALSHHFSSSR